MKDIVGTKYVTRSNGGFELSICPNGKRKYLGHSNSLISILMMRDWCENNNWKPFPRNLNNTTGIRNIIKNPYGNYTIYHKVNGKTINFGTYDSLDDAINAKEHFENIGWIKPVNELRNIVQLSNGKFIVIKYSPYVNLGCFNTLEEAIKERDLAESYNWNIDLLVEFDERINGKTIYLGDEIYEKRRL